MRGHSEEERREIPKVRIIESEEVFFDSEGFINDFDQWSEALFEILARESGLLVIDDRHRRVIKYLRQFFAINGRAPLNRLLREGTGMSLSEIEKIFPGGVKYGARRLAGLPNPRGCL